MCVPACQEKIAKTMNRRNFLTTAGVAGVAAVTVGCTATLVQPVAVQSAPTTPIPSVKISQHILLPSNSL